MRSLVLAILILGSMGAPAAEPETLRVLSYNIHMWQIGVDSLAKLIKAAEKSWLRLRGRNQLPKVIDGVQFKDGAAVMLSTNTETQNAA